MRRMYVAALASPLSVEYQLLDPVQHALAKDHAGGLYDFVHRDPALRDGERFRSVAALRRHCAEHDIAVAGDLHGVLGEKGPPRRGAGLRQGQAMGREALMEHTRHRPGRRHPILALVSEWGGGDKPPVLALAAALCRRGHAVHLLCDGDVADAVRPTDLPMLHLPSDRAQGVYCEPLYLARMAECGEAIGPDTPDPLRDWAEAVLPAALAVARPIAPRLLISTLFCMALADRLAPALNVPWAFVNPSFYFGEDARRPWEADFPGLGAGMFRHWMLPLARRADLVLHATDPGLDPPPETIPGSHRYVGPLLPSEGGGEGAPRFLDEPGDPWVLVTLSTVPQAGEMAVARAALAALKDRPVRVLVTLAPGHAREELGPVPANARLVGFVPHGPVLGRACLAVSHAGHGIVMRALRHGVPMALVPWGRDQPGVAARAEALGVAAVVPRAACAEARVAEAIGRVLAEPGYRDAARRAAERLRADDPVVRACGAVEDLLEGESRGASPAAR